MTHPDGAVGWSAVWIVVFPVHTHLLFVFHENCLSAEMLSQIYVKYFTMLQTT